MSLHMAQTLRQFHLRPTRIRSMILSKATEMGYAFSHTDVEKAVNGACDRVTIYRTLRAFLKNGLVHRVVDGSGLERYALGDMAQTGSSPGASEHLHFKCLACQRVSCLSSVALNNLMLPEGYRLHSYFLTADGICKNCG
ncbi:MAG: transcriptional repressor [candidate division Zixibacteria bacterium]|nr:transcriptional repressor [candidate division Zixibacteria bacterium]